jgi:hypothetical protein
MDELINKLWLDLPTECINLPTSVTVDKGEESCAGIALSHLRTDITRCKMTDAFKEAVKTEFKFIKLIPVGKVTGTLLDIADLTSKALSAKTPEDLEADLVKYGFGKVVGDDVVKKLRKVTNVPEDEVCDVLGNLTKLFYKQLWDKAKNAIIPKGEKYSCQPQSDKCKDNIYISIEPYTGDDGRVIGKLVFSADGNCNCQLACAKGMTGEYLNDWSAHGEMLLVINKAEVIEEGLVFKDKVLQVTVKAENPTYHVQANCDCSHASYHRSSGNSVEDNTLFASVGFINEDASGSRFNTYGADVAYTHPVNSTLGVTGDLGLSFGNNNQTDYTKLQLLAGISLLSAMQQSKIIFSPHVLAGLTNIHSKFYSYTSSTTSPALAIGTDIIAKVNQKTSLGLRIDYNPVFHNSGVSNNFRFLLGVPFSILKK